MRPICGPAGRGSRLGRLPGGLLRHEGGATAVEFAIISLPFFGLLFAIIQVSLILFLTQGMQTAVNVAARELWTREEVAKAPNFDVFRERVCSRINTLNCDQMHLQVKAVPLDADVGTDFDPRCFEPGKPSPAGICYQTGGAGDFVIVRAAYEWPIGIGVAKVNGKTMLIATAVFRNERFQ
ncbi:TadE/TadG family type IV pilus assembly protein [Terrihabitans sp. B22-R8]|uniref:TadE/TadG family type IV pilus assembly protein n=1 Tax=Terrihabitans sp. B22-R8 TaxID=3425128 RepID=UPI00403C1A9B